MKCKGYAINLTWAKPLTPSDTNPGKLEKGTALRMTVEHVRFPPKLQFYSFSELDRAIDLFDDVEVRLNSQGTFSVGPFRAISLQQHVVDHMEKYVHSKLMDLARLTVLALMGPDYSFNEQNSFHILYPKFFPNIDPEDWQPKWVLDAYFKKDESGTFLLNEFKDVANFKVFDRVKHLGNGWDAHVVPFIKRIMFENVFEEDARTLLIPKTAIDVERSLLIKNIKLSVFFMCLAIHSFKKDFDRSIHLRKWGINLLSYHLDEYDHNHEANYDEYDSALLLAMLLQIHIDYVYGVYENHELNFAIGEFLTLKRPLDSPCERVLKLTFTVLHVFYQSTQAINYFNYSIPEDDKQKMYLDLNENYDLTKEVTESSSDDEEIAPVISAEKFSFTVHFKESEIQSQQHLKQIEKKLSDRQRGNVIVPKEEDASVYLTFGLPENLIQLFHAVVQLTNHKNVFQSQGLTPRNYPRICAETEDKLMTWNVESYWKLYDNEYDTITNVSKRAFLSPFHEGLYYNVTCFHNALIVYYKRLIPGAPVALFQAYIDKSLDAMESLLAIPGFSPSFWPILVCGCDGDEARIAKLWNHERFNANYWRAKQILYEAWQRRSEGEIVGFMDLVREWDVVLCLG